MKNQSFYAIVVTLLMLISVAILVVPYLIYNMRTEAEL